MGVDVELLWFLWDIYLMQRAWHGLSEHMHVLRFSSILKRN